MNCDRASNYLALLAGDDLSPQDTPEVIEHLRLCTHCQQVEESLRANQSLLRSFGQQTVSEMALGEMRRNLFEKLERAQKELPWRIRLERFLIGEFRRPRLALATVVILLASLTVLAQLRNVSANRNVQRVLSADSGTIQRLADYRQWFVVGSSLEWSEGAADPHLAGLKANSIQQSVFMSPDAFQDFATTGAFPEGTMLLLESRESASPNTEPGRVVALSASVKDRHSPGGWKYFQFTGELAGAEKAKSLADEEACRACHVGRGATDHVFTQFYPVLRSASGVL